MAKKTRIEDKDNPKLHSWEIKPYMRRKPGSDEMIEVGGHKKGAWEHEEEEVEEDVVDDDDDDDLDNENSLRSIEAKLDRALSDVSHLTVDNLSNSLSQSLGMKNDISTPKGRIN